MTAERSWFRALPDGKQVSALGFGCSSIWARPDFDEETAQSLLAVALESGINHFDTGPSYGRGKGEERLGRALAGQDASSLVLATKVGTNLLDGRIVRSFSPSLMQASFDASMVRLGIEQVDFLYLHGPSLKDLNAETYEFLRRLKAQGRIKWSAINSFDNAVLDTCVDAPVDAVMLQYNVSDQRSERQIERLNGAGKIVLSGTALGRASFNLSAFFPRNRAAAWYLARMLRHEPGFIFRSRRLARRLSATGKPATDAAIQFVTGHTGILSNLFGTSRAAHMAANARAGHMALTPEQRQSLVS